MRVLSGAHPSDTGSILIDGQPVSINNPRDAKAYNIETIYQTLALADNIDAPGNVFLGREKTTRLGALNDSAMEAETRKVMGRLNPKFRNFKSPVSSLSGGQRQSVAIARAVHFNARILIMDEPTAALAVREVGKVLDLIQGLKEHNVSVILISHRMPDIFAVCDRIAVLRQGKNVGDLPRSATSMDEIVALITGAQEEALKSKQEAG
jgi:D-xylose transport system ATP-binding protein